MYNKVHGTTTMNHHVASKHSTTLKLYKTQCFNVATVAPPLWDKCEGEAHTPKSGKLESSGTPENSELNCRGQNTLHWSVLDVIGKGLEV
jgi:hypothetical protein